MTATRDLRRRPAPIPRPAPIVRVLHAGPAADSSGGIAAVIAELCAASGPELQAASAATWWPGAAGRSIVATLLLLARLPGLRRSTQVVHVHLSERGSFLREGAVVALAHALGYAVAATLHGADFAESAGRTPRVVGAVLRRADVVFGLGGRSRAVAESLGARRVVVVRNPIGDRERPQPREAAPNVVFAGVIGRRKGFDLLAAAWPAVRAAVPGAVLHVAGPSTDLDPAALAALPGVVVHGPISRDAVGRLLDTAAVACLPSRREALPMFVLEGLARGVPVVTSDAGELADLAACEAVRILPNPVRPAALAEGLIAALQDRPDPAAAYDWVAANAFSSRVGDTLLAEYRAAIAGGRAGRARRRGGRP